jgi:hypothetical protein
MLARSTTVIHRIGTWLARKCEGGPCSNAVRANALYSSGLHEQCIYSLLGQRDVHTSDLSIVLASMAQGRILRSGCWAWSLTVRCIGCMRLRLESNPMAPARRCPDPVGKAKLFLLLYESFWSH